MQRFISGDDRFVKPEPAGKTFILTLAVEVAADSRSQIDDDRILNAIMGLPEVLSVSGLPPIEREPNPDGSDESVWAYVEDAIDGEGDSFE